MATFCFFDVLKIKDPAKMDQYRNEVLKTVNQFGGRYVLIGGPLKTMEGDWSPSFPVIIVFPNQTQAYQWYESEEYAPLKALRQEAAEVNAVFMQGL